jgi:hypothetical protein
MGKRASRSAALGTVAVFLALALQGCGFELCLGSCDSDPAVHTTSVKGHGCGETREEAESAAWQDAIYRIKKKGIGSYRMKEVGSKLVGPGIREEHGGGGSTTYQGSSFGTSESEGYRMEISFRVTYW